MKCKPSLATCFKKAAGGVVDGLDETILSMSKEARKLPAWKRSYVRHIYELDKPVPQRKIRKSRKRIFGNARFLMMLCRDVRRRWLQYGENRKIPKGGCWVCRKRDGTEIDHIEPVGKRPYTLAELPAYIEKMTTGKCQRLCEVCHQKKTKTDRGRK
jgi:hypothetical protein